MFKATVHSTSASAPEAYLRVLQRGGIDDLAFMAVALVLLSAGAEGLVKGSAALALRAGLSPRVVGLTIVAFGTSSPELVVSIKAGLSQQGDIAVGNVVGYPDGRQRRAQDGITGRLVRQAKLAKVSG